MFVHWDIVYLNHFCWCFFVPSLKPELKPSMVCFSALQWWMMRKAFWCVVIRKLLAVSIFCDWFLWIVTYTVLRTVKRSGVLHKVHYLSLVWRFFIPVHNSKSTIIYYLSFVPPPPSCDLCYTLTNMQEEKQSLKSDAISCETQHGKPVLLWIERCMLGCQK